MCGKGNCKKEASGPIATISFDLSDSFQKEEFEAMVNHNALQSAVYEFTNQFLRNARKYGAVDSAELAELVKKHEGEDENLVLSVIALVGKEFFRILEENGAELK